MEAARVISAIVFFVILAVIIYSISTSVSKVEIAKYHDYLVASGKIKKCECKEDKKTTKKKTTNAKNEPSAKKSSSKAAKK